MINIKMRARKRILSVLSLLAVILLIASIRLYNETPGDTYLGFFYIAITLFVIGVVRILVSRKFDNAGLYKFHDFVNIFLIMVSIFIHGHHEQEMLQGQILSTIGLLMTIAWGIYAQLKLN